MRRRFIIEVVHEETLCFKDVVCQEPLYLHVHRFCNDAINYDINLLTVICFKISSEGTERNK